jgi:hypothetical protein
MSTCENESGKTKKENPWKPAEPIHKTAEPIQRRRSLCWICLPLTLEPLLGSVPALDLRA